MGPQNPIRVSRIRGWRRVACCLLSVVCLGGLSAGAETGRAAEYRPILVLEKMDLSNGLQEPFGISMKNDGVTPAATGSIVDDADKGKALHITDRSSSSSGLTVDLDDAKAEVGELHFSYKDDVFQDGEFYALTFSIKAETGKSFYIMPVLGGGGGKDSNGYLGNVEARWKVTDEWATIGLSEDGVLSFFAGDETYQVYQPDQTSWCSLYFVTFSDPEKGIWSSSVTDGYYISEMLFWGPKALENSVAGFAEAAAMLPDPAYANQQMEFAIAELDALYEGLSAGEKQDAGVVAGKERMDALRDAMTGVRNPFAPVYTYEDKSNLLAPYGDLESFDGSTLIWSETPGESPTYTLIEGGGIAKQGDKCLEISNREWRGDLGVDVTQILRDNGPGEYQFSCWVKSKEPGSSIEVLPLLLYVYNDGTTAEYEIGECIVGNEWSLVGVMENEQRFFRYQGEGPREVTDDVKYVALRLYVTNMDADPEYGDELYGDYYIDDLRFWKTTAEPTTPSTIGKPTAAPTVKSTQPTEAPVTQPVNGAPTEHSGNGGGLSMGTGIVIGVAGGVVVLAAAFCVYWFLLRKQPGGPVTPASSGDPGTPEESGNSAEPPRDGGAGES